MVRLHPEIRRRETVFCLPGIGAHFPSSLYDEAHLQAHFLDLLPSQCGLTTSGRSQPERVVLDKLQTLHSDHRVAELACQGTATTTAVHWSTPFDRFTTRKRTSISNVRDKAAHLHCLDRCSDSQARITIETVLSIQ